MSKQESYQPPNLRNSKSNMYNNRNTNVFKSFNKSNKYNNRYNNRYNQTKSNNISENIEVMSNFPEDNIKNFNSKFNIVINKNNNKNSTILNLKVIGKKEDINRFKNYIDSYVKKEYKNNNSDFPEMFQSTNKQLLWGDKNGKDIGENLEKRKFLEQREEKEKERLKILEKANKNNMFKDRNINIKISNLPKLNEELDRTYEEYYDYLLDPLYTKTFISEKERIESELTDEDQYDIIADKYSEKYSEYWLDDNGEEIFEDDVITKKEKMELANL